MRARAVLAALARARQQPFARGEGACAVVVDGQRRVRRGGDAPQQRARIRQRFIRQRVKAPRPLFQGIVQGQQRSRLGQDGRGGGGHQQRGQRAVIQAQLGGDRRFE